MGDSVESPKVKICEIFDLYFPTYLAMGMTYDLYWNDRPELAKSYRKAHELKAKENNLNMWLQGAYFREAILSTVGNMFSKSKYEYISEPFALTKKEAKERDDKKRKAKFERMKRQMELQANAINKKFKGDGV